MRETATLEFKQQLSKSYLKTVSAYANYGTGRSFSASQTTARPSDWPIRKTPAFASNTRLTTQSIQCLVSSWPSKGTQEQSR